MVQHHARLRGLSTVVPEFRWQQGDLFRTVFSRPFANAPKAAAIFERAAVETRYMALDLPDFLSRPQTIETRSAAYLDAAAELGRRACLAALADCGLTGADIDLFIVASCTGFAMPDLDVLLGPALGLKRTVSRLTIGETGSHAGLPAAARAWDHVRAYPAHRVLVLVVEVSSANVRPDPSGDNVVSSAIFADGAAAFIVEGADVATSGLQVLAAGSSTYFETAAEMTYRIAPDGLHFGLGRAVPDVLAAGIGESVDGFLAEQGLDRRQIDRWVSHPGGRLILDRIEQTMGFAAGQLASSRQVLANYGNMAAATVFFVLAGTQDAEPLQAGERVLMLGYGPGLGIEMLLLQA